MANIDPIALARAISETEQSFANEQSASQTDMLVPTPYVPGEDVTVASQITTPLRQQFSEEGFKTASQAAGGLAGGEGVVDFSGSMPLYSEGGTEVSLPEPIRPVVEYIGDAFMAAAGLGEGAYGYLVGGFGDLLVKSGAMTPENAQRLSRDLMAMPEAFAGSPSTLMRAPRMKKPTDVVGAPVAVAPSASTIEFPQVDNSSLLTLEELPRTRIGAEVPIVETAAPKIETAAVGGITEAQVARRFTPDELAAVPKFETAAPKIETPITPPIDEYDRIGTLIRNASGTGFAAKRARKELSELAVANPEAAAAAERLGIELPADVFSDNIQIREAIGTTRSIAGSEASAEWRDNLLKVTARADEVTEELLGATDLSTVSDRVLLSLSDTRDNLDVEAEKLFDAVDNSVPKGSTFEPNNIIITLNNIIEELGGTDQLSSAERKLFSMVTSGDRITYAGLMRKKREIGRAIKKGDGPFKDADNAALVKLYSAISKDQLSNVERLGGKDLRDNVELANGLYAKARVLDERIKTTFGKDTLGSIAGKLRTAVEASTKGDVSGFRKLIRIIPEDLRREAVASAIGQIATSTQQGERGFGFSQFSTFYSKLRKQKVAYKEVAEAIGPESSAVLRDLYEISRRVTETRAAISTTGKANQSLIRAMTAERLMSKITSSTMGTRIIRGTGAGGGALVGGPVGAMLGAGLGEMLTKAKPDQMKMISELFRNDDFKKLVEEASTGNKVSEAAVNRVANSKSYRNWAATVGIEDPRNWLQGSILVASMPQEEETAQ